VAVIERRKPTILAMPDRMSFMKAVDLRSLYQQNILIDIDPYVYE